MVFRVKRELGEHVACGKIRQRYSFPLEFVLAVRTELNHAVRQNKVAGGNLAARFDDLATLLHRVVEHSERWSECGRVRVERLVRFPHCPPGSREAMGAVAAWTIEPVIDGALSACIALVYCLP